MVLTTRDPGHKIGCQNHIELFLQFNNNTKQIGFGEQNLGGAPNPYDLPFNLRQIATDKLSGAYTVSSRNKDGGCGCGACGATSINNERINVTMGYATFLCTGSAKSSDAWDTSLAIKRTPQLTIVDPNPGKNYFEVDDPAGIVINSYSGFDASDYNWEYIDPLNVGGGWIPFIDTQTRKYNGLSNLTLTLADINTSKPPKNPRSFYQSTLSIRQVGVGSGCNYASKQVDYTLVKTPPLVKSITPTATQCAYSKDGEVQFAINGVLETDETFGFDLNKLDPLDPTPNTYKPVADNAYEITSTGKLCNLIKLAPGVYKGFYQTKFPNGNGNFFKSQPQDINFTIDTPPALKYTARMAQPKCATDGAEIVVNATGGTPSYWYSINGAPAVKYIDTDEKGLPKGDYSIAVDPAIIGKITIQVTDSQSCFDDTKK
jgi:hypothetical protein